MNVHEFNFELEDDEVDQSRIYLIAFDNINLKTERRYLVKGLIPRTGLIVVWGPPKSGKSFIVFDLVMHIALRLIGTIVDVGCIRALLFIAHSRDNLALTRAAPRFAKNSSRPIRDLSRSTSSQ